MRFNYRHSSPLRYRTGTSQLARFIYLPVPTFLPHHLAHLGNVLVQDCAARPGPRKITQVFKYRYRSGFRIFRGDHNFARPRAPNRFEVTCVGYRYRIQIQSHPTPRSRIHNPDTELSRRNPCGLWVSLSFGQSKSVSFATRHANPVLGAYEYRDSLVIKGCFDAESPERWKA